MIKYSIFIIFGIILYLLLNLHEKFEAVGECNCRDSDDQPIYDRENCENIGMTEVASYSQEPPRRIPRFNSNGMPCIYKDPLQYMHDNVMVQQRVCEIGDTNLRCMVQFYDSKIGGSCQTNTLYLYYLFIGFPLRREDIEWLNRFNFNLADAKVFLMVNNYLLNRSIMRSTLYSLRLNPNNLGFADLNKENLTLHNLYQLLIDFEVKNTNLYKSFTFIHILLLYVSSVNDQKRIWLIDGCNKSFLPFPTTIDNADNENLQLEIVWQLINGEVQTTDDVALTQRDFMNSFRNGHSDNFENNVKILQIGTLNEGESIPELGETGFIDKACNPVNPDNPDLDRCNNNFIRSERPLLTCVELNKEDRPPESRCVVQNTKFQFCSETSRYCLKDSACIVDNDYGGFEYSFYHTQLLMNRAEIDSDIAKSNPKCLPTGELNRPCDIDRKCNHDLVCVNSEERDSLGNPKLPICIREQPTQCAANCNIM